MNPLKKLHEYGQSIWVDFIQRDLMKSGRLERMIREDGIRGMTSNPKMFDEAISQSDDYDEAIEELARHSKSVEEAYEALTVEDVQMAADEFRSLYDQSGGTDGFVSYEVSPHLAHDAERTIEEARRLWVQIGRPNIFIKVPGTREGLKAIQQLTSEGINVNVTLLFGLPRYREVALAYVAGLEERLERGYGIDGIASVASFFLSRIDVLVDSRLDKIIEEEQDRQEMAEQVKGETAVASAKLAFQIYREIFGSERFERLRRKGARPQRLLWASTGTKDPEYSDVKYVEPLIGPDTVNTAPLKTIEAYRDHGEPRVRIEEKVEEARSTLKTLEELGIDIDQVTQRLEDEGVDKFIKPYDNLLKTLEKKLGRHRPEKPVGSGTPR